MLSPLTLWRWLRAEHEATHPFPVPRFILDILEILMTVQDDINALATGIATDVKTLGDGFTTLHAKIADLEKQHGIDLTELKNDAAALHNVAQGLATAIAPASPAPAEPTPAPVAGTLAAGVTTGPAADTTTPTPPAAS
ncbi:hypothetical protein [Nocardia terpenica]|uniref:Uncharacterized protein n=1 Tax=Nocardia terpenica TaxID=455432 RepID=A0A164H291_9NOCA|nr:hypothetical protein [Nocardia terpenica]KZM68139.1 hypothetical protein AWN90_09360 [Nocardia terpenica]NQE89003.1 hypothetical protein [Nocardia terpenica]